VIGVPNSFNKATTATGSVALRIDPITKPSGHPNSPQYYKTNSKTTAPKNACKATTGKAKIRI